MDINDTSEEEAKVARSLEGDGHVANMDHVSTGRTARTPNKMEIVEGGQALASMNRGEMDNSSGEEKSPRGESRGSNTCNDDNSHGSSSLSMGLTATQTPKKQRGRSATRRSPPQALTPKATGFSNVELSPSVVKIRKTVPAVAINTRKMRRIVSRSLSPSEEDSLRRYQSCLLQDPTAVLVSGPVCRESSRSMSPDHHQSSEEQAMPRQSSKAKARALSSKEEADSLWSRNAALKREPASPRRMRSKSMSPSPHQKRVGAKRNRTGSSKQREMRVQTLSPVRRRTVHSLTGDLQETLQRSSSSKSTTIGSSANSLLSHANTRPRSRQAVLRGSASSCQRKSTSHHGILDIFGSTSSCHQKTVSSGNIPQCLNQRRARSQSPMRRSGLSTTRSSLDEKRTLLCNNSESWDVSARSKSQPPTSAGLRNTRSSLDHKRSLLGDGMKIDNDNIDLEEGRLAAITLTGLDPRLRHSATNPNHRIEKDKKGLRQSREEEPNYGEVLHQFPQQLESTPGAHRCSPVPFAALEEGLIMPGMNPASSLQESSVFNCQTIHVFNFTGNHQGLVEATPVEATNLPVALAASEFVSSEEEAMAARNMDRLILVGNGLGCLCLILIVLAFAVLLLAGVFSIKDSEEASTFAPSSMPSPAPTPYLIPLPEETAQTIVANPQSPQARAYQWLKDDILLETYSPYRQLQRFALVTLYYATNGEAWDVNENWLSNALHECLWQTKGEGLQGDGITRQCDPDGNFLYLYLTKNRLSGSLPPELGLLTKLEAFDVATNSIRGTIPSQIGLMTSLYELILNVNQLTGEVPSEIGQLTLLEQFFIHTNLVTGTIMTEVGLLTNMIDFEWAETMTRGTIPTELGLMTQTTFLLLFRGLLEGPIPSEIGLMTNLSEGFGAHGQSLTGTVPTEVGRLTNLESLELHSNSLTGPIPTEVGRLTDLFSLILHVNSLTGMIPTEFGKLSGLVSMLLHVNSLTGMIPSEIGLMEGAQYVLLNDNELEGFVPSELGGLSSLIGLGLGGTNLSGTVPVELGALAVSQTGSLEYLTLNETVLTGVIPADLCDITKVIFDCSEDLCGCDCVCQFAAQGSV
ncbi:leucine rich repeat [Seminavis robusta]|uniref:Leucine rich repeat n=1 Tax=Seminavis robusta TaxID=568900 RepID=A0A9N8DNJ8_9STRA|nr:leucine rich repeat [Seminavis robusta]|eukprot:Sro181_g079210.1 leucine rich repeat (1089) ;mRNA; r:87349-90615